MEYNITPIILGNNGDNLYGSVNDAILIYNLFYIFYLNENIWNEPYIFLDNQVNMKNINTCIANIKINNNIILIYFSGHSNKNGNLLFHQLFVSSEYILNEINNRVCDNTNIFFIIDSCFSSKFISNNDYCNIKKIYYLVSCDKIQKSKEIIVKYNSDMFTFKNINEEKDNIVIGIFTFYLYKVLKYKNMTNIFDWKNITKNNIWKMIDGNFGQTIYYIEK